MVSVGGRDEGRKWLGLGFGGGVRMEENELEEGEACSAQEDGAYIDPEISLSYIDEKLQDVLGHFQKDFEGGVSAENLGAKFGGYGSFLPSYQRSPSIRSQPRSPPKVPSHNGSSSPHNPSFEGALQIPTIPTGAFISKTNTASTAPPFDNSGKRVMCISALSAGESIPQHDSINKPVNVNDQKRLKVRIKVGPDNFSTRNIAAIHSDLGLDISPSALLEDSSDGSGGLSSEFPHAPDESPMTVLQIMTCFPVPGGYLLSPLPDSLLRLTEKESPLLKNCKTGSLRKGIAEACAVLTNETLSIRDLKGFLDKKMNSVEKNGRSMEVKASNCKDDTTSMEEVDIETIVGQDLVCNSLNTPVLSSSRCVDVKKVKRIDGKSGKDASRMCDFSTEPNKTQVKDRISSPALAKENQSESMLIMENNGVDYSGNETTYLKGKLKLKTSSVDKALEERKTNFHNDVSFDLRGEGRDTVEENYDISKADTDGSKGRKDHIVGPAEPTKQKSFKKPIPYEQDGEIMLQGKDQLLAGKRKLKGSQANDTVAVEFPKENLRDPSSVAPKEKKKSSHTKGGHSRNKSKALKSHTEPSRSLSKECHEVVLGGAKAEQMDNQTYLLETYSKDKPKDTKLENEKDPYTFTEKSKDWHGGKKVDNPSREPFVKVPLITPLTCNASTIDAVPAPHDPAPHDPLVIQENWVCCDRCQKWRLLPYGKNPDHLPKKWLCSMLTWLPAMNRCNISEEETTNAVNSLYQAPAPDSDTNMNGNHNVAASSITLAKARPLDQTLEPNMQTVPSIRKKKHGLNDASDVPNDSIPIKLSNSVERTHQASSKSRSLDAVNHSHLESNPSNKMEFENTSISIDYTTGKHNYIQKEDRILGHFSDGGHFMEQSSKHSTSKNKREVDQNGFRTSKKIKTESSHYTDEDRHLNRAVVGKSACNMGNGLSTKSTGKYLQKYNDFPSSKGSKHYSKDNLPASIEKSKTQVRVIPKGEFKEHFSASDMERSDKINFAVKEKKVKKWKDNEDQQETLVSSRHFVDKRVDVKEEFSESELRKEKKTKVSKSEGKESSTVKADGGMERKGRITKILLSGSREHLAAGMEESKGVAGMEHQIGQYQENAASQRALDGTGSLKQDIGFTRPSTAATSSSSMVSGSCKSKANFQEVRGSPVESVSSSPFRIYNTDRLVSRKTSTEKDDAIHLGFPIMRTPKRYPDGEDDGEFVRSGSRRKEEASSVQRRSLESQGAAEYGVLDSLRETFDYQDKEENKFSGGKAKDRIHLKPFGSTHDNFSPSEFEEINVMNVAVNTDQRNKHHSEPQAEDHSYDQYKLNNHHHANGSSRRKSSKNSSRFRESHRSAKSDADKDKVKVSDSFHKHEELYPEKNGSSCPVEVDIDSHDYSAYHEYMRDENHNFQEKDEKDYLGKEDSMGKLPVIGRREKYANSRRQENEDIYGPPMPKQHKDLNFRIGVAGSSFGKSGKSNRHDNLQQAPSHEGEKASKHFIPEQIDRLEMALCGGKPQSLLPSRDKQEMQSRGSCKMPTPVKGIRSGEDSIDAANGDAMQVINPPRKSENPSGADHSSLRHPTPNGLDAPSPVSKDAHTAANAVLKEARDLKHTANRLKNEGLELESTSLYFQASLKYLQGASLLEPSSAENTKYEEVTQSMQIYSDTAKLCRFCAQEYERGREMAAAALAYKCMEVAYMKVTYYKYSNASKDQHELQTALQVQPALPGESPSSSASDVDNSNNLGALDKAISAKGASSPQIVGNHVIAARNRPKFVRMLSFAEDAIRAMDASRKSQSAYAAANVSLEEAHFGVEGMSSVRKVLDFNFHDVEGLLRLVRLSVESISH